MGSFFIRFPGRRSIVIPEASTVVIALLLRARRVSIACVVLLLVALLVANKRVSYEQSIRSFFADDDPAIVDYRKASDAFGDDNFVFVAYDDPALLTPGGMDRVAELAAEVGPSRIEGVTRVESIDAMPLLWKVDDGLIAMDSMPGFARKLAQRRCAMRSRTSTCREEVPWPSAGS